ncbi:MAG: outer membrane beta-barrel protein [Bdellovibrionales bacterium]|nr:outer membrane beta-barrel protein [Bdellovibrionales bacterium]
MRNIILSLLILSSYSKFSFAEELISHGQWTFDGFVDLRYQEGDLNSYSNGFLFHDGAVQILGEFKNNYSLYLDISLGWQKEVDSNNDGVPDNFENTWGVAKDRAQAFLMHKNSIFKIILGQFDSPFGFENNDSRDLFFAKHGLMFRLYTPTTHLGVKAEAKIIESIEFHVIASNPQGQGSYAGESPEYGVQILFRSGDFYLLPGYYTRREQNESYSLWNFYAGLNTKVYNLHLEFNSYTEPQLKKSSMGYMLLGAVRISDWWTLATRLELADRLQTKTSTFLESIYQTSFSLHYHINESLKVLTDITSVTNLLSNDVEKTEREYTLSFQQIF